MKKLGLLAIPLVAISLLASCGNKPNPDPEPKKTFAVAVGKAVHLSLTTIDNKPLENVLATEGENFTFKMKAGTKSNSTGYKIPTQLSIYVGDSTTELERDYYTIDEIIHQYEAKVTIHGEKVTDNIKINGEGIPQGYYAVDVSKCFGVNATVDSEEPPYFYTNEDGTVTFTQLDTYDLPKAENIIVKFDGKNWINPSSDSEWCTYEESSHTLTLKANKATSNVMISARSPQYQILEELNWKKISDYSTSGYAPYLFYAGDEKIVTINEQPHKARIIGFNHDNLAGGAAKAGITFEFFNLISDENGHSLALIYDNNSKCDNTNFIDSHLRKALDGGGKYDKAIRWYQKGGKSPSGSYANKSVINMLPTELVSEMKSVEKKVVIGDDYHCDIPTQTVTYNTQLFILSKEEYFSSLQEREAVKPSDIVLKDEGDTYTFYSTLGDNSSAYIHKQVDGDDVCSEHTVADNDIWNYAGYNLAADNTGGGGFWMRSPHHLNSKSYYPYNAFTIRAKSGSSHIWDRSDVSIEAYGVAPAFCL